MRQTSYGAERNTRSALVLASHDYVRKLYEKPKIAETTGGGGNPENYK